MSELQVALSRALVRSGVSRFDEADDAARRLLREISEQRFEVTDSYAKPLFWLLGWWRV